ncbi:MAG: hypothetical protein ACTSU0_00585, partial [Alphaproteobacteria bacterium]
MSTTEHKDSLTDQLIKRVVVTRFEIEELVLVPILAVLVALLLGGVTMLTTGVDLPTIGLSYFALLQGSVGSINSLS